MASKKICPSCRNDLEWGYCEICDEEIPEGQEIIEEVPEASHPWIVGKPQPRGKRDPQAQMDAENERLKAQLAKIRAENGGELPQPTERWITDDRLYTS